MNAMKKEANKELVFVYLSSIIVYLFHIIYAFIAFSAKEGLIILGICSACEFLMYGSLFVFKNVEISKRVYYVVAITSCFLIADRLNTIGLVIMLYMGILYQLSIYMDSRVLNEAFGMSQIAIFVYLTIFYDWSNSALTQGFFVIQEVLLICFWIILLFQVKEMREYLFNFEIKTKQAEEANNSKNTFLANMSHEIRTPLNAIKGMGELIADRELSPIEREYVNNIQKSSDELLALVNNLLDFANIESGRMVFTSDSYDMGSLINDICSETSHKIGKKPISFILDIAPDFPHLLKGDSKRISQLLENVLDNAVKFTTSGTIYMGVRWEREEERAHVYIDVTDTGVGISEDNLRKIFDAFSQADMHRNRRAEGTGLGLSIVKKLVESMDGDIRIVSRENEGTTVKLDLFQEIEDDAPFVNINANLDTKVFVYEPNRTYCDNLIKTLKTLGITPVKLQSLDYAIEDISKEKSGIILYDSLRGSDFFEPIRDDFKEFTFVSMYSSLSTANPNKTLGIIYAPRPITILSLAGYINKEYEFELYDDDGESLFSAPEAKVMVVDDNETNLRVAEGFLLKYDVQVKSVISGYDCIKELNNTDYDIVFMDHMMPNLDGAETTQLIRKAEKENGKHQIIVALTANAVRGAEEYLLSCGMDAFMAKPINSRRLNMIMKKYIPAELQQEKKETVQVTEADAMVIGTTNIDTEKGIANMGGSKSNYLRILQTAYNEGQKQIKAVRSYFESGDIKNYTITVHAVKSTMLGLGATELSEMAKAHEFAGKDGNTAFIRDGIDSLIDKFDNVLTEMKEILDGSESGEKPDEKPVEENVSLISEQEGKEKIEKAIELLEAFDSEEALGMLQEALGADNIDSDIINNAISFVDEFEYEKAIECLKGIYEN